MDIRVGEDGNFSADAGGEVEVVTGAEEVIQEIVLEMATWAGEVWRHPTWGYSLHRFLQLENIPINQIDLIHTVQTRLSQNPSIQPGTAVVQLGSFDRDLITLTVSCTVIPVSNPAQQVPTVMVIQLGKDGVGLQVVVP
jgi:hypothetical protein